MMTDDIRFWISAICGTLNMVVSFVVLRKHSTLGNPVMAVCIGGLTVIGFLTLPGDMLNLILMPYVALAITLIFLLILLLFRWCSALSGKVHDHLAQRTRSLTKKPRNDFEITRRNSR